MIFEERYYDYLKSKNLDEDKMEESQKQQLREAYMHGAAHATVFVVSMPLLGPMGKVFLEDHLKHVEKIIRNG